MLSKQRRSLPSIIERICQADPRCGIVLQGSVQKGYEKPTSDIDLTVVVNDQHSIQFNEFIARTNEFGMMRVHLEQFDLNVDINWVHDSKMRALLKTRAAQEWYIFSRGEIVHDPNGLARACQQLGQEFFRSNPAIATAWREQEEVLRKYRVNPVGQLQYPKWPDFSRYLSSL